MHKYTLYAAYGWLALTGLLHFVIDVVAQHLRGQREPGPETSLYYGLNTAYALGQLAFGLLGLLLAWRAMPLLSDTPALVLSFAVGLGWLAIAFQFMGYWEPRFNAAVYCLLLLAAFATR